MKNTTIIMLSLALGLTACAKKEDAAPEPAADAPEPAVEAPVAEEAAAPPMEFGNEAFLKHMHAHADQIDTINFALADGDLEATMTPAFWLGRHDDVDGVPEEWRPFVVGMRAGAKEIEEADDLETARAAAERVSQACQGCHAAAGIIE